MMYANVEDTMTGGTMGFAYGFLMQKSGSYRTSKIRQQFELKDFTLFKTFGTSIATGCVAMAVTSSLGYTSIRIKPTYVWGNLLGGAMVGAGTYLAGSSLEAALGQLGALQKRAGFAIAGGLTGALTYGMLDRTFRGSFLGESGKGLALHTLMDLPFAYVAIPFAGLVAGVVYMMEQVTPHREPVETVKEPEGMMDKVVWHLQKPSWNPYTCGVLIGLLQIPTAMYQGNAFGIASPYFSTAACIAGLLGVRTLFFELYKTPSVYWTFPLDSGTIVGSCVSAKVSTPKESKRTSTGLTTTQKVCTFTGCFLTAVGSAMAVGSPSVHGLSGVSQLSVGSMLSLLGVLSGGIVTAQLLYDKRFEI